MKTIREIAEEIGVSKQAVQKRISREPLFSRIRPHATTNGNTLYIDGAGERLIKAEFFKAQSTTSYIDKSQNVYTDFIQLLQEQMIIKDRQIEELTAAIKLLTGNTSHSRPKKKRVHLHKKQAGAKWKSAPIERLFENS